MYSILVEVAEERARQDTKWGEQNHPNYDHIHALQEDIAHGPSPHDTGYVSLLPSATIYQGLYEVATREQRVSWDLILLEELAEAFEEDDDDKLRYELIQVAAVAVNWIECIDRRKERVNGRHSVR